MFVSLTEFSWKCSQSIKISGTLEIHETPILYIGHPVQACSAVCIFKICKVGVIFSVVIELLAELIH